MRADGWIVWALFCGGHAGLRTQINRYTLLLYAKNRTRYLPNVGEILQCNLFVSSESNQFISLPRFPASPRLSARREMNLYGNRLQIGGDINKIFIVNNLFCCTDGVFFVYER